MQLQKAKSKRTGPLIACFAALCAVLLAGNALMAEIPADGSEAHAIAASTSPAKTEIPAFICEDTLSAEKNIFYWLTDSCGYTTAGAAGVMANMYAETGYDCTANGDFRNGVPTTYGLCGWHGAFWTDMINWCDENGCDWRDTSGQIAFLKYTLKEYPCYAELDKILTEAEGTDGAAYAAASFCRIFERPADPEKNAAKRAEYADGVYETVSAFPSWEELYTARLREQSQSRTCTAEAITGTGLACDGRNATCGNCVVVLLG